MSTVGQQLLLRLRASPMRRLLLTTADGLIAAVSLWAAVMLRFGGHIPPQYRDALPHFLVVLIGSRMAACVVFRLHRWSFRTWGISDAARVPLAGASGTALFALIVFLFRLQTPPRSVVVLDLFFSVALMALVRFAPRLALTYRADRLRSQRKDSFRTIIVGAGATGEMLLRDLQRSAEHSYKVIGLVDDDPGKWGCVVSGKPVLGGTTDLPAIIQRHRVHRVLIAIPRFSPARIREILASCSHLNVQFKTLPVSFIYLQERAALSMLQHLTPEDLLPRPPAVFAMTEESAGLGSRVALVTGGAGSIGSEICVQLLEAGIERVVTVDRDENELYFLLRRLESRFAPERFRAEVADLRDQSRMRAVFSRHRPQDVFHAAAHKQVPLMEEAPCEAVKNNVEVTKLLLELAESSGVEHFVFISSDKAVHPQSVMGATKRIGEMLVRVLADEGRVKACAVRFGNVLDSAGSVAQVFRTQIAAGGPITVTHPDVRRYFMTATEAVGLVLQSAYGDHGPLCALEMGEQIRIIDLARYMITMSGLSPGDDIQIEFTGLRPGEKLFEELLTEEEERARHISEKIVVINGPPPPNDLIARVDELVQAANAEDETAVRSLLGELVPTYEAAPVTPPAWTGRA